MSIACEIFTFLSQNYNAQNLKNLQLLAEIKFGFILPNTTIYSQEFIALLIENEYWNLKNQLTSVVERHI